MLTNKMETNYTYRVFFKVIKFDYFNFITVIKQYNGAGKNRFHTFKLL